jgi:hypothetical protein
MKRRIALGLLVLIALTLYYYAPAFVRWRVSEKLAERYPDVKVDFIEPQWGKTVLHTVTFDRGWVCGKLDTVMITWKDAITIQGGIVRVYPEKRPSSTGEGPSKDITITDLEGTVISPEGVFAFGGLSLHGPMVTIDNVGAHRYGRNAYLNGVKFNKNHLDFAHIDSASMVIPEDGPDQLGTLTATAIEVSRNPEKEWRASIEHAEVAELNASASAVRLEEYIGEDKIHRVALLLGSATIEHPKLFSKPLTVHQMRIPVDAYTFESGEFTVWHDSGFTPVITGNFRKKTLTGKGTCSEWLEEMPDQLKNEYVKQLDMTGNMSFDVSKDPPHAFFLYTCKATCDVPLFKNLKKTFAYDILEADGTPGMRAIGPGGKDWTPLAQVSPDVITALTTMEDPGFFQHRGLSGMAIEKSFQMNLKANKFVRGGSTLTMQLAKNLWLTQEKTIGRKVQEAFLTMGLESCLSKEEILALYVNVVEFGKGLYGIGPASRKYFKTSAMGLAPEEAFYLVSILPRPRTANPPDAATLARVKKLRARVTKEGRIPDMGIDDGPLDAAGWDPSP